jgi:hypothetical protein
MLLLLIQEYVLLVTIPLRISPHQLHRLVSACVEPWAIIARELHNWKD